MITNPKKELRNLKIQTYILTGSLLMLIGGSLLTSLYINPSYTMQEQFLTEITSKTDIKDVLTAKENIQFLDNLSAFNSIFVITIFLAFFGSYFVWFYFRYKFFLANNTNPEEQKPFRKTPLESVLWQIVPIYGFYVAGKCAMEIGNNNSIGRNQQIYTSFLIIFSSNFIDRFVSNCVPMYGGLVGLGLATIGFVTIFIVCYKSQASVIKSV